MKQLSIDSAEHIFLDGELMEDVTRYTLKHSAGGSAELTLTMRVKIGPVASELERKRQASQKGPRGEIEKSIEKMFPRHMMEKSGLIRYAGIKGNTRIYIDYDANSGIGKMKVYLDCLSYESHSDKSVGTSEIVPSKQS